MKIGALLFSLFLLSIFSGCVEDDGVEFTDPADSSKCTKLPENPRSSPNYICIIDVEVDGKGTCTFAVLTGYREGGLTLVECDYDRRGTTTSV